MVDLLESSEPAAAATYRPCLLHYPSGRATAMPRRCAGYRSNVQGPTSEVGASLTLDLGLASVRGVDDALDGVFRERPALGPADGALEVAELGEADQDG